MIKTLLFFILFTFLGVTLCIKSYAQQVTSECVVTQVGSGDSTQSLPSGCNRPNGSGVVVKSPTTLAPNSSYVYYCQTDPQWNPSTNGCFIGPSGCGPTSLAMIANTLGVKKTPLEMGQLFATDNVRACTGGAGSDIVDMMSNGSVLTTLGLKSVDTLVPPNTQGLDLATLKIMKNYIDTG